VGLPLDLSKVATVASDRGSSMIAVRCGAADFLPKWGPQEFRGVPFQLIDPLQGETPQRPSCCAGQEIRWRGDAPAG
jgi:hypothetical protein